LATIVPESLRDRGRRRLLAGTLIGLASVFSRLLACGSAEPEASPRLVVLYATCSVNKSRLAPYDPAVDYTPHLASLAERSLVFERHQTEAGQSGIAFASIFSGAQAPVHGVYSHPSRIDDDVTLITEVFADAGWDVHAWLGHAMATADLNYAQGVPPDHVHSGLLTANSPALAPILDRLESDPAYRAFLVTNFTLTHGAYRARAVARFCERYPHHCDVRGDTERFDELAALYRKQNLRLSWDFSGTAQRLGLTGARLEEFVAVVELLYESRIHVLDGVFGSLMEEIEQRGLLPSTLLAFTADHGEILYREDAAFKWTHGFQLAPEVLGVPLLIYGEGAGVRPGRYAGVTRSIDVFPTLAALAGVSAPPREGGGVDLSAAVRGEAEPPDLIAFSHTALFSDPLWRLYRNFETLRGLHPSNDPQRMWVQARRGDVVHQLVPEGATWSLRRIELAGEDGAGVSPRPGSPDMEKALRAYRETLLAGLPGRAGKLDPVRSEHLLRELGYIE